MVNNTIDIKKAIYKGKDIYSSDGGHYNVIGNEIFGLSVANEILAKKILSKWQLFIFNHFQIKYREKKIKHINSPNRKAFFDYSS